MRNFIYVLIFFVIALVILYVYVSSRTDTFTGRWVAWKSSEIDDYKLFPHHTIENAPPVFKFQSPSEVRTLSVAYHYKEQPREADLAQLLQETCTTAFIVTQGDELLYEGYFNGWRPDFIYTSFSVAKSITSLLVGMAIDDGYINSLDDPVTDYIPELAQTDPRYRNITLEHLISMKSGIAFKDTDIPWHDKSRAYYHPDLRQTVLNLPIAKEPGVEWLYNTFNPIIMGVVLERATGRPPSAYLEEKLWQRLGMEYDATWSIDSEAGNMVKMESGINARAIDYVKIGRLMLNNGNWNGEQIVSPEWIASSMAIVPENNVAKFGEHVFYQNGWWIQRATETDLYAVYGWGHRGQYLFIFPDEGMVVARFGRDIGDVDSWREVAQNVVKQLQQ